METALILWEACVIPSLLHGAGTWTNITAATEKNLNSLQIWHMRMVLGVGPGAPLAALRWDLGLVDMKLRIWKEKISMILHLRSLGEGSLASKIYREQTSQGWPGLVKETKTICEALNIEDCNTTNMETKEYKKVVIEAIKKKDEEIIKALAKNKNKCSRIFKEEYGQKAYIKE